MVPLRDSKHANHPTPQSNPLIKSKKMRVIGVAEIIEIHDFWN